MFKLPTTQEWYEKLAFIEDNNDVIAGIINPVLDSIQKFESASIDIQQKPTLDEEKCARQVRLAFIRIVKELRLDKNLSYTQLSKRVDVDIAELKKMEEDIDYRATPRTLIQLACFYSIPSNQFLILAGAVRNRNPKFEHAVAKFAAQSSSYDHLTHEQRHDLHAFVRFLQNQPSSLCTKQ